jgi:hypothetical protein
MTVHSCGVLGCHRPARWRRTSAAHSDLHFYLCTEHWQDLRNHSWSLAGIAYEPISTSTSDLFTELCSIRDVENGVPVP